MPLYKHLHISDDCNLYIWKIEEEVDYLQNHVELSDKELEKFNGFGSESRKKSIWQLDCWFRNTLLLI